jgi:hypothetical protein
MRGKFAFSILLPFVLLLIFAAIPQRLTAQATGPMLVITPTPVDFDTVSCGSSRCMDVVFRNSGDTALTVQEFDALAPPFSGGLVTPLTLQPGESHTVNWCYDPTRVMNRDSVRVRHISDNRIPYSFGYLVDASGVMTSPFPGASSAIDAVRQVLSGFVATMMADGSPSHEGAVFAYSTSSQFRLLRGLTDERAMVQGAIPGSAAGAHACVWQGMDRAITFLATARHRRVLIVVNGSEDAGLANCGPYSAPGVASAAIASDMIVCAISINGAAQTALADIAAQTGGIHRSVASLSELVFARNDIMLHLQRSVRQYLTVSGEVVSPSLAFVPDAVLFPVTMAGDTARADVWLRNVGTAPMDIGRIEGETDEFTFTTTKRQVPPGDSLEAIVSFIPTDQSYLTTSITAQINGCDLSTPRLTLRGMSYLPVNPSPGPVLANGIGVIDAGRFPCDKGGEMTIPLRNAGDEPLQVFHPQIQCPDLSFDKSEWQVDAGSESPMRLMLQSGGIPGPDSCVLSVSALSRLTTSTMFVIDGSSTLRTPWEGINGADAARLAIGRLLADMSSTPELHDRMGVLSCSMQGVQTLHAMSGDRDALAALLPAAGNTDTTALLAGIEAALDTLDSCEGIRRLVVLTSGSTDVAALTGRPDVDLLRRRARESGAQIAVLQIGNVNPASHLQAFIDGSGAAHGKPRQPDVMIEMLQDFAAHAVDTVGRSWLLRWTNISSDIALAPTGLVLDESHAGEKNCADVMVTNTGEVPLEILNVSSSDGGFTCASTLPLVIPVGGRSPLRLCYEPSALGVWSLTATIRSNSCLNPLVTVPMSGEATDSNTVILAGDRLVRPGGLVSLPVRMDHALPALHDVRRLTLRVAYDPSLLYPDMDTPLQSPAGSSSGFTVTVKQEFDRGSGQAVTAYDIVSSGAGLPIISAGTDHALYSLRFRAYLGRVVKTDVELLDAAFPGSAVALGFSGVATVRIDSMLWLEDRLVDASALWGVLGKNAPNPSNGRSLIGYTLHEDLTIRLALYDMHGRLQRIVQEGAMSAGPHEAVIDTRGLPAGAYVCRLESSAGALSRVLLVSNQEVSR